MPTYTVDLDAPPEHRWDAVVKDKGPAVCSISSSFNSSTKYICNADYFLRLS